VKNKFAFLYVQKIIHHREIQIEKNLKNQFVFYNFICTKNNSTIEKSKLKKKILDYFSGK